ncbi:hypothetical protein V8E36_009926 [Tilletia maclaganii]
MRAGATPTQKKLPSSSSAAAPLALTLSWSASARALEQPRKRRRQRRSHHQSQQQQSQLPSIFYNGLLTAHSPAAPDHAQHDADPWSSSSSPILPEDEPEQITAILPLSMDRILLALGDGSLAVRSLASLSQTAALIDFPPDSPRSTPPTNLHGRITSLQQIQVPTSSAPAGPAARARAAASGVIPSSTTAAGGTIKLVIGATEQGEVLVWDAATLTLFAELPIFTGPVDSIVLLDAAHASSSTSTSSDASSANTYARTSRLHGCLACTAADHTLAILHLDISKPSSTSAATVAAPSHNVHVSIQHMIPSRGISAPLSTLFLRNAEPLLIYADGRARLWDTAVSLPFAPSSSSSSSESMGAGLGLGGAELRRSIGEDQALSLVEDDNAAYDALYHHGGGGSGTEGKTQAARPASMFASSSSQGQQPAPPVPHTTSDFLQVHPHPLAPVRGGGGGGSAHYSSTSTPDNSGSSSASAFSRPRFSAASHAAQALLLSATGLGPSSAHGSRTASPNPLGPSVPSHRWVRFDFLHQPRVKQQQQQQAKNGGGGGLLSLVADEVEMGDGEHSSYLFTLRVDLRRAIEAAAKALVSAKGGGGGSGEGPSPSSPLSGGASGGAGEKIAPDAAGAVKALGIIRPVLGVLLPALDGDPKAKSAGELKRALEELGRKVGVDAGLLSGARRRPRLGYLM